MSTQRRAVSDADISALRSLLSGTQAHVLTPLDPAYPASIERWSRAAIKPAGVSVQPTTSEEVAIAIKYAFQHNLDVAVKGGGHSTAGASSTNGGLLIDLGRMRDVETDLENRHLYVQGGCLWMDVDDTAWKHGLATVGGTVADTGVGGLTLGGGYGMLSGQHGLVIDNTIAFTVVTSNGEIKRASKEENPDLFWALNGAGQNFGVTTEIVLQAYPQKEVYMGTLVFAPTPETITKLTSAINDLYTIPSPGVQTKLKGKLNSLLGLARPPEAGGGTVLLFIIAYDGSESECKQLLQPILEIGPMVNTLHTGAYPEVNKQIPTVPGFRSSMKGAAYVLPIRPDFVESMIAKYDAFMDSPEGQDAAQSIIAWEIYDPTVVVAKGEGQNSGCFANRGYHMNSLIMPMWSKAENDQVLRQFAREMSLEFKKELEVHGQRTSEGIEGGASVKGKKGAVLLYGNYDQYDEISRDIFGDHYPRLQEIKAKYDPDNMFNKLFPIQLAQAQANL